MHEQSCCQLHVHKSLTDLIDLNAIAREFISVNERRMRFFGEYEMSYNSYINFKLFSSTIEQYILYNVLCV